MFMYFRAKKGGSKDHPHQYLQIVESYRDGHTVRQRVIATLGRLDALQAQGAIDSLVRSLARFSETVKVLSAARAPAIKSCRSKVWGPALVFGRLWEAQGLAEVLLRLSSGGRFQFDLERVCFGLTLQRLCEPGSDLQGSEWLQSVESPGLSGIELHQMYRTVGWLFGHREELERELFFRDRDLFHQELDLVFLDTTSTYIYREKETEYAKRGYSRDHRPDLPQMILCVAVDRRGWPISWEIFPGNTADAKAFEKTISKFRLRFKIGRVSIVADRGMISRDAIELLVGHRSAPYDYILGCRLRRDLEVRERVLADGGAFQKVAANLKVKEVLVEGRRYIVCRNDEEAEKDALAREGILGRLRAKLESGQGKSLIGNLGYRRFLKGRRGAWQIDEQAVKNDARFDGMFVLRTNLKFDSGEIAQTYKGLWRVERTFREQKSTLEVRPIFHHQDETRIGHIVASFLGLRLEVDLQRRLEQKGIKAPWPDLMRDLKRLQAVRMEVEGIDYLVRTDLEGCAYEVFRATGVKVPTRVIRL
jgi:hypothetical protein